MADIMTAVFESSGALKNAFDDLVSTGIPQEEIRFREHEGKHELQVLSPSVTHAEIEEILKRHGPVSLRTTERAD